MGEQIKERSKLKTVLTAFIFIKNRNDKSEILKKYTELAEGMGVEFQSQPYEKQGYYFLPSKI